MSGPSRRSLLAGLGGAVAATALGGCTSEPAPPAPPSPDDLLRDAAVLRERSVLAAYDAALLALPALTARLLPLREDHVQHLAELTGDTASAASASASASPSPSPSASASPAAVPAVPPPAATAAALTSLVEAERSAGTDHGADALAAKSRPLAALLASLSASELSHPVALA